jgi:crotonyl-CoA reductase
LISSFVRRNSAYAHHLTDFQVIGSDAAGIIVEVGANVTAWAPGDEVCIHCNVSDPKDPMGRLDSVLCSSQAIWGYETNFGAFAEYTVVQASQLLPRPAHLDWAVSASCGLTLSTAYRMLVSANGAQLRSGEACLIWGAAGGLGAFAIQLSRLLGAEPIAVVSSEAKADFARAQGANVIVNRQSLKEPLVHSDGTPNLNSWRRFRGEINRQYSGPIEVVFEHVGRETLGFSTFIADRGGRIVTCAASSGHNCTIDLRYLWMNAKRVIGSHISNEQEAADANRLVCEGKIKPIATKVISFAEIPHYLDQLHAGRTIGKVAVQIGSD